MATNRSASDLPDVVASDPRQLQTFLERVRETLQTGEGRRGAPAKWNAKMADLKVGNLLAGHLSVNSYIRSSIFIAGSRGFSISADGNVEFNNGVFRGELSGATGTFAGSLTAATGTFVGAVQVNSKTWGSGSGFWTGMYATDDPRMIVGNDTTYMRWSAAAGLELKLAEFTSSTSPTSISTTASGGYTDLGDVTASATGGIAPVNFTWFMTGVWSDPSTATGWLTIESVSGTGNNTASIACVNQSNNSIVSGTLICVATDANNRVAFSDPIYIDVTRGTPP